MKSPPIRLLDDVDAPRAQRTLLEAARNHPPVGYDVAKGALRLRGTLDALAATHAAAGAASGAKTVLVTKGGLLLLSAAVVGLAGVGYYMLRGQPATSESASPSVALSSNPPAAAPMQPAAAAAPVAAPAPEVHNAAAPAVPEATQVTAIGAVARARSRVGRADETTGRRTLHPPGSRAISTPSEAALPGDEAPHSAADAPSVPAPKPTEPVARPAEPAAPVQPLVPAPATDSRDELHAIARARLLVSRDPRAALALLTRLQREQPHGYFVEEREALTVLALAAAGRSSAAESAGESFLRAHPRSPFADRIRKVVSQ